MPIIRRSRFKVIFQSRINSWGSRRPNKPSQGNSIRGGAPRARLPKKWRYLIQSLQNSPQEVSVLGREISIDTPFSKGILSEVTPQKKDSKKSETSSFHQFKKVKETSKKPRVSRIARKLIEFVGNSETKEFTKQSHRRNDRNPRGFVAKKRKRR